MRFMSICVFSLACAIFQPSAMAQGVIYQCVGAKGAVLYQNSPCPADASVAGVKPYSRIDYRPDLANKVERDRIELERRKSQSRSVDVVINNYGPQAPSPKVQRCRDARAHRQATLDAWGLARTYDLLQRLDREVWEACKDVPGA